MKLRIPVLSFLSFPVLVSEQAGTGLRGFLTKGANTMLRLIRLGLCALLVETLLAPGAGAQDQHAQLEWYQQYFALTLQPKATLPEHEACRVVVLVDTSASQHGKWRQRAFEALDALLDQLPPQAQVRLVAVDLEANELTSGFTPPGSPQLQQALEKLHKRVPLGSTDLPLAISQAIKLLGHPATELPARVVYIGDGVSAVNLVGPEQMDRLASQMRQARAPLLAYAVGPQRDVFVLAALAMHSGGRVFVDSPQVTAQEAGQFLAQAARKPVLWNPQLLLPEKALWMPQPCPPLRLDRELVVVGQAPLKKGERWQVQLQAQPEGGNQQLRFQFHAQAAEPTEDVAFLAHVVEAAKSNQGVMLPLLGRNGLGVLHTLAVETAEELIQFGRLALAMDRTDQARRLAQQAKQLHPAHPAATLLAQATAQQPQQKEQTDTITLQPEQSQQAPQELEQFIRQQEVLAGQLQARVQHVINQARRIMRQNPEAAINDLKIMLETVLRSPHLSEAQREQLKSQLEVALREATRRREELEQIRRFQAQQRAVQEEKQRLQEAWQRQQERVYQLMLRFDAIMQQIALEEDDRRLSELIGEAESTADAAVILDRHNPAIAAAAFNATMFGALRDAQNLRQRRIRGVLATLRAVERSHIPTSDEPPIVFPDPEVWRELTERRREYQAVSLSSTSPAARRIREALSQVVDYPILDDTPLEEAIKQISERHDIPITIDRRALEDLGLDPSSEVSGWLEGVTLRTALKRMLDNLELAYYIDEEVLVITSRDRAAEKLITKVYPVGDLVVPLFNPAAMGGMGMFGAFGSFGGGFGGGGFGGFGGGFGGFGGGFGGFGGGGFGGFGGGFGQFGGGAFGGGFGGFRVPSAPAWHAFDVPSQPPAKQAQPADQSSQAPQQDSLQLAPKTDEPKQKSAKPQLIRVQPRQGESVEEAWERYFATHQPSRRDVRHTVQHLMHQKKFREVVALIRAALRNRQTQTWMYEVMALAMLADDYPRKDIERALMSAAEWTSSVDDLLYLAHYLGRMQFYRRAFQLCRQVDRMQPGRHETYALALQLARAMDDPEALAWACVQVLSQEWPRRYQSVVAQAQYAADALLQRLKKQGQHEQAKRFEAQLQEAKRRDVVLVVSWTGEADIDLIVEEPTGTVCSFRTPRTSAGGVMLGDYYSSATSGHTRAGEAYVCAKGFPGRYRAVLRRVWGQPTAGKVRVDVVTHYGTPQQKVVSRLVDVGQKDALILFQLDEGRRQEPVQAHLLANDVKQLALARHLIARQLLAANNSSAAASFVGSRWRPFVGGFRPVVGSGAVGFMPVVVTLPEGTGLFAQAVVSADRRYVRLTALPFFSFVAEVNTFNMATGVGGLQRNAQGQVAGQGQGVFGGGFGGAFGGGGFGGGI